MGPIDRSRASLCQVPFPSPKCCQVTTRQNNSLKSKHEGEDHSRMTEMFAQLILIFPNISENSANEVVAISAPRQFFSRIMHLQNSLPMQNPASAVYKQAVPCFPVQTTVYFLCIHNDRGLPALRLSVNTKSCSTV